MSLEQLWDLGILLSKLMQMCDTCSVKDPREIVCVRERHTHSLLTVMFVFCHFLHVTFFSSPSGHFLHRAHSLQLLLFKSF